MLDVVNVNKIYGKKDKAFSALTGISLKFKKGTSNAIVGKSGSGKSTLLHILIGLDHPTNGEVLYNGKNILKDMNTDSWRGKNVGIVFQQFFLQPNDSVLDNVALPLKLQGITRKKRNLKATEALKKVGLEDRIKSKANDLSGGQKQRVAIARALVDNPSILIADEPTGNLDTENGDAIEKLLFELQKKLGTTLVIVTHDTDLAKRCERVVYLKDGKIENDTNSSKK
jgi:putative ABC transport system ATP-binding protein